jgi:hypothetical protein
MFLKETECGLDTSDSGYSPVLDFYEYDNKLSGFVGDGKLLTN